MKEYFCEVCDCFCNEMEEYNPSYCADCPKVDYYTIYDLGQDWY